MVKEPEYHALSSSTTSSHWSHLLSLIEKRVSRQIFDAWFRPAELKAVEEEFLNLCVPNPFFKDWYEDHYVVFLEDLASEYFKRPLKLKLSVRDEELAEEEAALAEEVLSGQPRKFSPGAAPPLPGGLNPRYTFERFVVGNSNQFAHAASLSVAKNPSRHYNPLFIYGGAGLGKTHLLQAIGHFVLRQSDFASNVTYVTSEKFTNDLINAIRYDNTTNFRNKYRNVDVLLIDDIQFIAGKERTQEEFFHTFNTLHEAHKQIVLSSDRLPKEIPSLEERLRSRFEWGLIADIQPPDLETKIAILKKKAGIEGLELSDDVAFFIASKILSNIRELEGSLTRLFAYASMEGKTPTIELAQKVLAEMFQEAEKIITINQIQQVVADFYEIKTQELKSKNRSRNLAFPRQIAMFLSRTMTNASLPHIGKSFGGKDHSTVLHACRKISAKMEQDQNLRRTVESLKNILTT